METVKVKNVKTGAIKEIKKSLASDYIMTGEYKPYTEEKKIESKPRSFTTIKADEE